jgi:hypothetical protein
MSNSEIVDPFTIHAEKGKQRQTARAVSSPGAFKICKCVINTDYNTQIFSIDSIRIRCKLKLNFESSFRLIFIAIFDSLGSLHLTLVAPIDHTQNATLSTGGKSG